MPTTFICMMAVTISAPVILAVMYHLKKPRIPNSGNYTVLQYPLLAIAGSMLVFLIAPFLFWVALLQTPTQQGIALVTFSTISLVLMFLPVELVLRRVCFDDDEIILISAWSRLKRLPWNEVRSFGYSQKCQEWRLQTSSGTILRIPSYLSGLQHLETMAKQKYKSDFEEEHLALQMDRNSISIHSMSKLMSSEYLGDDKLLSSWLNHVTDANISIECVSCREAASLEYPERKTFEEVFWRITCKSKPFPPMSVSAVPSSSPDLPWRISLDWYPADPWLNAARDIQRAFLHLGAKPISSPVPSA